MILALAATFGAGEAQAQRRVTLEEAIAAAEAHAPELGLAAADTAVARAEVGIAREYPDPALALGYSASVPRHHVELEQAIDYPWLRLPRIRAAEIAARASRLALAAERATLRYRVELAYVQAAGALAIEALSRENVLNGADLVRSVIARRVAGDVSDLDVELARVTLGQLRGIALDDSLRVISTVLDLQSLMGLPSEGPAIAPADTLGAILLSPSRDSAGASLVSSAPSALRVQAARERVAAREAELLLARRSRYPAPALRAGFEEGDPSEPGLLPTFGVSISIPIFSRGGAEAARARAAEDRARAEVALVERETGLAVARAAREREVAAARLEVDATMLEAARRVAALSATAYREGAYPLAIVLEAQRNARDAMRRTLEDRISSEIAEAAYRLSITAGGATP